MGYDRRHLDDDGLEMHLDPKYGIYVREGTTDSDIIKEMPAYSPIGVKPGETILDLGANIGGYANEAACNQKAGRIICVEPDPNNFAMLSNNVDLIKKKCRDAGLVTKIVCLQAAVVNTDVASVDFYKNNRRCKASHSTIPYRGREVITVKAVKFSTLVETFKPARIKVDIEGEEHNIFRTCVLPSFVKGIIMELHLQKDDWRAVGMEAINNNIVQQGFVPDERLCTKDTGKNWHCLCAWRRDP